MNLNDSRDEATQLRADWKVRPEEVNLLMVQQLMRVVSRNSSDSKAVLHSRSLFGVLFQPVDHKLTNIQVFIFYLHKNILKFINLHFKKLSLTQSRHTLSAGGLQAGRQVSSVQRSLKCEIKRTLEENLKRE